MTDKLDELIALSQEASSEKRRELLRGVTDMFLATPADRAGAAEAFDGLLNSLAADMEADVRAELAQRLAPVDHTPRRLALSLATDVIDVAAPMLTRSRALTSADLLTVASEKGQQHLRCISSRDDLTETVSEVIVERGDTATLNTLLKNPDAPLSRAAAERVIDKAQEEPSLHVAVVHREDLPPDLLNELYFVVEQRLRDRISKRNALLRPAELEAALSASRRRLATRDGALPADYIEAEQFVDSLVKRNGPIQPPVLVGFLRGNQRTRFFVAVAQAADLDFGAVRRIVERQDLDALTVVCRSAGYDAALFTTLALLLSDDRARQRVEGYRRRYNELPLETAQRTLRFWRMRRTTDLAA